MSGKAEHVAIDRERSAARISHDVQTLAGPQYTSSRESIRRYAYRPEYRSTLDHFTRAWEELGFKVSEDPIGNLVARNRPPGEPVFGIGSHCDSNRNGGKWDGTLGVVCALEVCRVSADLGLDLPLQAISFLEEEGSGFGQMVLGSRIVAGRVSEQELRERILAIDDGRPFWEHAEEAGYEPGRWRECAHILDDLAGWIELHIEQGRVLQDTGRPDPAVSARGPAGVAAAYGYPLGCMSVTILAADRTYARADLSHAAGCGRTTGYAPAIFHYVAGRWRLVPDAIGYMCLAGAVPAAVDRGLDLCVGTIGQSCARIGQPGQGRPAAPLGGPCAKLPEIAGVV